MFAWVQSLDSFFRQARLRYLGLGLLIAWVYGSWFSDGIFAPDSARGVDTLRISLAASAVGLLVLAFRPRRRAPLAPGFVFGRIGGGVRDDLAVLRDARRPSAAFHQRRGRAGLGSALDSMGRVVLPGGSRGHRGEHSLVAGGVRSGRAADLSDSGARLGHRGGALPLASSLMLLLCKNDQPEGFAFPEPIEPFSGVLPSLVKLAFCSMVCSIATGCVVTSASPESLVALGMDDRGILFYIAGGVVAGLIAVFAIAHTSRMSFSFLYEWAIPLIVFSLSLRRCATRRAMVSPRCSPVRRLCTWRCCSSRSSRASRRRDSVFPARRSASPCHGSAGISRGRGTGGIGIAALWPAAVLGARVPVRGDAAAGFCTCRNALSRRGCWELPGLWARLQRKSALGCGWGRR